MLLIACTALGLAVGLIAPPPVPDLTLTDSTGKARSVRPSEAKAVVIIFLSVDCPVANRYAPELARLARENAEGVVFYGVHCDPDLTAEQARRHATEYKLPFLVLLDPTHELAKAARVTRVPTAVVLSTDGVVLYHGRIDDRNTGTGKARAEPTRRDLAEAIAETLAGKRPTIPRTSVVGCELPAPRPAR
jgi:peroxiredoxin